VTLLRSSVWEGCLLQGRKTGSEGLGGDGLVEQSVIAEAEISWRQGGNSPKIHLELWIFGSKKAELLIAHIQIDQSGDQPLWAIPKPEKFRVTRGGAAADIDPSALKLKDWIPQGGAVTDTQANIAREFLRATLQGPELQN
jgi:hypothetical protein